MALPLDVLFPFFTLLQLGPNFAKAYVCVCVCVTLQLREPSFTNIETV